MSKRKSWAERLTNAKKRGKFIRRDLINAVDWRTCAIGEKHGWPSFNPTFDSTEFDLGMDFEIAVEEQDIPRAEAIYAQVQALPWK